MENGRVAGYPGSLSRRRTDRSPAFDVTRQHTLELVPYDPDWPVAFDAEAARLRRALGRLALRVDHNGSTAIPGLAAKAVIDIQVSVAVLQPMDTYRTPLLALGYVHIPHEDDAVCPFFHRPSVWPHTHHVHVVQAGGTEERRTLAFRDYLREHQDVSREYEALKWKLAMRSVASDPGSREQYARGKSDFIARVVAAALAAGYPPS